MFAVGIFFDGFLYYFICLIGHCGRKIFAVGLVCQHNLEISQRLILSKTLPKHISMLGKIVRLTGCVLSALNHQTDIL